MRKILLVGVTGLVVGLFGWFGVGHAQEFRHGNSATIGTSEKIDSSAYLAGRNIDVAGEVNGDLYCAGQTIVISGTIHGDILCAGQTITITGTVDGDVRVAAQTVTINSAIAHNLTVAAQDLNLNSNGKVGGDVTGGVSSANLNGNIGRDMVLGASDATVNGQIGRNIKAGVERLHLGSGAKVGGNIEYSSSNQLDKVQGATVVGTIHRTEPQKEPNRSWWDGIGFRIYWLFAMLLIALALILLFPALFQEAAAIAIASPWKTLLVGVIAVIIAPVLFIVLLLTVIGIPLALLFLLMWILVLALSGPFFGYYIGRLVWQRQRNPIFIMLVGSAILLVLYAIPFVGFLAILAALFMGTGMFLREITRRTPKPQYK